jgi:hypothetical protein
MSRGEVTERWRAWGDDGTTPAAEVAKEIGCSRSHVYRMRRVHGVETRTRTIKRRWREVDDWSEPAEVVAEKLGTTTGYVARLRSQHGEETTVAERWRAMDDDGSTPAEELAERLGCTPAWIKTLRRERRLAEEAEEAADEDEPRRCARCTAYADEASPLVEGEVLARLEEVAPEVGPLNGAWKDETVCLWCWLTLQQVPLRMFYESGAGAYVLQMGQ